MTNKTYKVIIAGTVIQTCETREQAEEVIANIRNSILGRIHPVDTIYIKEV